MSSPADPQKQAGRGLNEDVSRAGEDSEFLRAPQPPVCGDSHLAAHAIVTAVLMAAALALAASLLFGGPAKTASGQACRCCAVAGHASPARRIPALRQTTCGGAAPLWAAL